MQAGLLLQLCQRLLLLENFEFSCEIVVFFQFLLLILHQQILLLHLGKSINLLRRIRDLLLHTTILHDAFLHILDMNILLHADIFLHEVLQPAVHLKRNRTLKQHRKLLHVQSAQVDVVESAPEGLIPGCRIEIRPFEAASQVFLNLLRGHNSPVYPVIVFQ